MTPDIFRLDLAVRELERWLEQHAERLAWLEDRMAQVLAGMGEPCTRLPTRPVQVGDGEQPCLVSDSLLRYYAKDGPHGSTCHDEVTAMARELIARRGGR